MKRVEAFIIFSTILILAVFSEYVLAEMKPKTFSLSSHVGGYVFAGDENYSNGPVYGLGLGYDFTKQLGVEGVFNYIDTESEPSGDDVKGYIYRLDGLYHFMPDKQLVPYLAAGIGGITVDESDIDFLFNYGVGIKYYLTESLVFRSDIRHIFVFKASDDVDNNFAYTFGLTFMFGKG